MPEEDFKDWVISHRERVEELFDCEIGTVLTILDYEDYMPYWIEEYVFWNMGALYEFEILDLQGKREYIESRLDNLRAQWKDEMQRSEGGV